MCGIVQLETYRTPIHHQGLPDSARRKPFSITVSENREICFRMSTESLGNRALFGLAADVGSDRRSGERMPYRTMVTALVADGRQFEAQRCWLVDISTTGARVHSRKPIPSLTLFLRIVLDDLSNRYVRAEIVNERVGRSDRVYDRGSAQYEYGVRFIEIVSAPEILEQLDAALRWHTGQPVQSRT